MPTFPLAPSEKDMREVPEEITAGAQEVSSDPNHAVLFRPLEWRSGPLIDDEFAARLARGKDVSRPNNAPAISKALGACGPN